MNTIIISCQTIEDELRAAMKQSGKDYEIRWIESGLHNVPQRLHGALQQMIDSCLGCKRILLAMGFCGNSVLGLHAGPAEMVLPRVDDCVTLLCGSPQKRAETPYAYFLTDGWLRGERNIWREYQYTIEKYGEKRGSRIFHILFQNYRSVMMLDTGCFDAEKAGREIRKIAETLGLEYGSEKGTISYLTALLEENWDPAKFLVVPPHAVITPEMLSSAPR